MATAKLSEGIALGVFGLLGLAVAWPVLATRAAPEFWNKGWGTKTLFRYDPKHLRPGVHRPMIKQQFRDTDYPDSVLWVNGSGRPLESWFKLRGWRSIRRTVGYDWAQVNHYAVKSMDASGNVRTELAIDDQPSGLGWLPDGDLLVVSMTDRRVLRVGADGTVSTHADLSGLATFHTNDMLVDDAGMAKNLGPLWKQ